MIHKFPFLTKTLRAISVRLQTEITNSLLLYLRNNQLNETENISNVIAKFSKFSLVPDKTGKNKSKLTYLKRKLLESDDQKETRLAKRRNPYQTDDQKESRLAKRRSAYQTDDQKETILANRRKAYETDDQK